MEFVFDDCLMESIDVTSLEERNIDEVIRENAHTMLDCEMDLDDILTEASVEILTEGMGATIGTKIKEMWEKLKKLVNSIIEWIKSLFKKDKEKPSDKDEKVESNKNGNESKEDNKSTDKEDTRSTGSKRNAETLQLVDASIAKKSYEQFNEELHDMYLEINDSANYSATHNYCRTAMPKAVNKFKTSLENSWKPATVADIVGKKNGEFYRHTVCSDLEDVFMFAKQLISDAAAMGDKAVGIAERNGNENDVNLIQATMQVIASGLNSSLSLASSLLKEDKAIRMKHIKAYVKEFGNGN